MYLYNMSENIEILLGIDKNVNSVNVDNYMDFLLENKQGEIIEYDIENSLSATEIFDAEREANDIYRIYGRIEYLSLLNGLSLNYKVLGDFFLPTGNSKNINNSFKFYLIKPGTGYTSGGSSVDFVRYFDVIATPADFELYNAGYTNNVYGDRVYAFNFNKDFDVTPYVDNFGFPLTELFLYAQYQPGTNGFGQAEIMSGTTWNTSGVKEKAVIVPVNLNIGDRIYGDLVEYSKSNFLQFQLMPQIYYISTPYKDDANVNRKLQWSYNPFISLRLKYFYDNLNTANSGSTSYTEQISIPYYATEYPVGTGNFVWRDIIPQGNFDPQTGVGVDYPFINMKRYLFAPIILDISPDLYDSWTYQVFTEIKYGAPTSMNQKPNTNLNNIGKPCL
jgi:hypothetical protein